MELTRLLEAMLEHGASDLHLQSGSSPMLRRGGRLQALEIPPLSTDEIREVLPQIAPGEAQVRLESDLKMVVICGVVRIYLFVDCLIAVDPDLTAVVIIRGRIGDVSLIGIVGVGSNALVVWKGKGPSARTSRWSLRPTGPPPSA